MEYVMGSAISPEEVLGKLQRGGSGSLLFHFAVVKSLAEDGAEQVTTAISFERAGDMESEMTAISSDIKNQWNVDDVLLVRRVGTLYVGDIISLVAIGASRSKDAFEACQYGLKRLKKMTTIKKKEIHSD